MNRTICNDETGGGRRAARAVLRFATLVEGARPFFHAFDPGADGTADGLIQVGAQVIEGTFSLDRDEGFVRLDVCLGPGPTSRVADFLQVNATSRLTRAWIDQEEQVAWLRAASGCADNESKAVRAVGGRLSARRTTVQRLADRLRDLLGRRRRPAGRRMALRPSRLLVLGLGPVAREGHRLPLGRRPSFKQQPLRHGASPTRPVGSLRLRHRERNIATRAHRKLLRTTEDRYDCKTTCYGGI
jgi:hypothetical protein